MNLISLWLRLGKAQEVVNIRNPDQDALHCNALDDVNSTCTFYLKFARKPFALAFPLVCSLFKVKLLSRGYSQFWPFQGWQCKIYGEALVGWEVVPV